MHRLTQRRCVTGSVGAQDAWGAQHSTRKPLQPGGAVDLRERWIANRRRRGSRGRGRGSRSGARRWRGWLAPWRRVFRTAGPDWIVTSSVSSGSGGLVRAGENGTATPLRRRRASEALISDRPANDAAPAGSPRELLGTARNGFTGRPVPDGASLLRGRVKGSL